MSVLCLCRCSVFQSIYTDKIYYDIYIDIDECQINPLLCPSDATCQDKDGSYECLYNPEVSERRPRQITSGSSGNFKHHSGSPVPLLQLV